MGIHDKYDLIVKEEKKKSYHRTFILGIRSTNGVYTGEALSLLSGFRIVKCSQEMDLVLILVS